MMVKEILLAGAGGFAGSALRYAVSAAVVSLPLQGGLPVGTFAAWLPPGGWQVFAMAGFCGGFTTFSAFSLETVRLMRSGQVGMAAAYAAGSVIVCLLFAGLGLWLGGKLSR